MIYTWAYIYIYIYIAQRFTNELVGEWCLMGSDEPGGQGMHCCGEGMPQLKALEAVPAEWLGNLISMG